MPFRMSLKKLIRRDPAASLRERAAELQARIPAPKPQAEPQAEVLPSHAEQVTQAGATGDVLAACGIDHRDGTVSYADATGKVVRRPMAHWIAFTALQMHTHVQQEIGRRRMIEAGDLSAEEHAAWEARIRRELRSDAVHALTFRSDRAFEAAQALRTSAEPATQELREQSDAELVALAPVWEAAVDLYQRRTDEENAICAAASDDGWPGPAPGGSGPEWRAWFQQKEDWRERTGVAAAEEASGEAGTALFQIEEQIADLPAASLVGLKLKARVAQRSCDIGQEWVVGLGEGLVRDILAFTDARARQPAAAAPSLVGMLDLASATMKELRDIQDIAEHVGAAAYAYTWGPRCRRRENHYGAPEHNDLGRLMLWLGDALTSVESAVDKEAARRTPDNLVDREIRLMLRAGPIIDNGDPDEIATFAGELLVVRRHGKLTP
uniref:hypothetical protein n=1 Tax=Methylobacterium sp. B34 TaxID=95563 RepID=UPI00034C82DA|nr:hypothetical protein [Methylobacterium sp. B34]